MSDTHTCGHSGLGRCRPCWQDHAVSLVEEGAARSLYEAVEDIEFDLDMQGRPLPDDLLDSLYEWAALGRR